MEKQQVGDPALKGPCHPNSKQDENVSPGNKLISAKLSPVDCRAMEMQRGKAAVSGKASWRRQG
jgi:hypothetical protein